MEDAGDSAEWVVQRIRHDRRRLTVFGNTSVVPASWLTKLRRLVPELNRQSPGDLLRHLRQHGRIELGVVSGRDAHRISESLQSNGFEVAVDDASDVVLLPVNRSKGAATIIENQAESDAFCRELIAKGASIEEVEA